MERKFITVTSLALLQVVIVANLQPLSANAVYGFSLPFLYLMATIGFFIPCLLMVGKLATQFPQTGGAFIWVEQAFGKKCGFFAVALLWISNLLWYPSIFSFIAENAAYVIHPGQNGTKIFIMFFATLLFWAITILNCLGIKISTRLSVLSALVGILLPLLLIITGGVYWWFSRHPFAISLAQTPLLPNLHHIDNLGFIIAIVVCFFGIEIPAVHAGNVVAPHKNFPKSLWISGALILALTLSATVSIALIVPATKLSVVTGLLDALDIFIKSFHWQLGVSFIFLLVLIGNLGSILAWMLGSTRAMFIACCHNHVLPFLQKTNRKEAPIGVLVFEAILFTLASLVFLLFPKIADSFWLLLDVASQITLIYYILLFFATIKLSKNSGMLLIVMMVLGAVTAFIALLFGFISPPDLSASQARLFKCILIAGLSLAILLPWALLTIKEQTSSRL